MAVRPGTTRVYKRGVSPDVLVVLADRRAHMWSYVCAQVGVPTIPAINVNTQTKRSEELSEQLVVERQL